MSASTGLGRLRQLGRGLPERAPGLLLGAVLLATLGLPVGLFLVVAFSPRLFSQGTAWLTGAGFTAAIQAVVQSSLLKLSGHKPPSG